MATVPFANGMLIPGMGGQNPSGGMTAIPGMPNSGPAPFSDGNMFNIFPANGSIPFNFSSLIPGGGGSNGSGGFNIFNLGNTSKNNMQGELTSLLGTGFGNTVGQALQTGGFSPAIAQAFINQSMPLYGRGMEGIANEFSGLGDRFSSAAAIGMGDYSSQFFNNLMAQIAGLDQHAIDNSFSLLQGLLPNQMKSTADSQGGFMSMLGNLIGVGSKLIPMIPGMGATSTA